MTHIENKLKSLGLVLPPPIAMPAGAVLPFPGCASSDSGR